ncbi:MAG TPA: KUP/HAK/KT family potassium transporter, partial [Vineibacter sp.]|nr:KUP/HAK/KT family potassium transporter [Vineibacter sp.]
MTSSDGGATGAFPGASGQPGGRADGSPPDATEPEPAVVGAPSAAATDPVYASPSVADAMLPEVNPDSAADRHHKDSIKALTLAALGVVYGDIGTSPLYTLRETFHHSGGLSPKDPGAVLGVLSLVFWALILTVTIKYVVLILRADNRGEGGVLALARLASNALPARAVRQRSLILLASIIGLALFFGDGLITPAISVLSAVEGFEVASSAFEAFVIPVACLILVGLFLVQRRGTEA